MGKTEKQLLGLKTVWEIVSPFGDVLAIFRNKAAALGNVPRFKIGKRDNVTVREKVVG